MNTYHWQLFSGPQCIILEAKTGHSTHLVRTDDSKRLGWRWWRKDFKRLYRTHCKSSRASMGLDSYLAATLSIPLWSHHGFPPGLLLHSLLARLFRLVDSTVDSAYLRLSINMLPPLIQYHPTDSLSPTLRPTSCGWKGKSIQSCGETNAKWYFSFFLVCNGHDSTIEAIVRKLSLHHLLIVPYESSHF